MLDLVSTLLPAGRARLALLAALVPWSVTSGATVPLAAVGLGLVLLAGDRDPAVVQGHDRADHAELAAAALQPDRARAGQLRVAPL
jgi:hypothetical protein